MQLAMLLLLVFLLTGYSFACGFELGHRWRIDAITPRNIINPGFRLIDKNPHRPIRRSSR